MMNPPFPTLLFVHFFLVFFNIHFQGITFRFFFFFESIISEDHVDNHHDARLTPDPHQTVAAVYIADAPAGHLAAGAAVQNPEEPAQNQQRERWKTAMAVVFRNQGTPPRRQR